jgi:hypothetical protein
VPPRAGPAGRALEAARERVLPFQEGVDGGAPPPWPPGHGTVAGCRAATCGITAETVAPPWMHEQITAEEYESWSEEQCAGVELVDGMIVVGRKTVPGVLTVAIYLSRR